MKHLRLLSFTWLAVTTAGVAATSGSPCWWLAFGICLPAAVIVWVCTGVGHDAAKVRQREAEARVLARARKAVAEEEEARQRAGMPAKHPEQLTVSLSAGHETWLEEVCGELWPRDEFTRIVAVYRRQS